MKARTRTVTVVLMSVVLLLLAANVAFAHDWWLWHWHKRTLGMFMIAFTAPVSAEAARADWDAPFNVMNLPRVTHHSDVSVLDGNYGDTGWGGLAQIIDWSVHFHCWWIFCYPNPGAIVHAHATLNTTYFWSGENTGTVFDAARGVQCQEIGHTFGLDHQDENQSNPNLGTCMDYTSNPLGPPANTKPNAHDYDELYLIYNHADAVTTVGSASATVANNPNDWGKAVRFIRDGRGRVFVKDLGAGRQMVTFVIWAPL